MQIEAPSCSPLHVFLFLLLATISFGQVIPPCGNDYGTNADESNISLQMRYGTISDAVNAIDQGKNTRGTALGCPQLALTYAQADTTEPTLAQIENTWLTVHAPAISAFSVSCPRIGRYENNAALGAYYAMQAGYFTDTTQLADIAQMMYDQQYAAWNTPSPMPRNEGVYGYVHVASSDPCYPGGVVGSSVGTLCSTLPAYCVAYTGGQFAGENFAISGQDDANNWFDGGLAYDHGWVGIQMIESSILQPDPAIQQQFRTSAELAGQYAIVEYPVKNHNYTAKLIWLLAELYAWTGDSIYQSELNHKLDKNLIPGILWDANQDGMVDGTTPAVAFNSLTATAQTPGRMWDGHNSLPWYQAMNTWAMVESYVAFRDQGDLARANALKPYAIAMLDNLAAETLNQGVVSPNSLGVRDITYALLLGIWKISQYENEAHSSWEQAAWALWNAGYFSTYSTHTVCVGLYLCVQSGTPYTPLHQRDDASVSRPEVIAQSPLPSVYPNPCRDYVNIQIPESLSGPFAYAIHDLQGRMVQQGELLPHQAKIQLDRLPLGLLLLKMSTPSGPAYTLKLWHQ